MKRNQNHGSGAIQAGEPMVKTPMMTMSNEDWINTVNESGQDMVCKLCGFGFFAPAHSFKKVSALLHPTGQAGVLDNHEFWMCLKCYQPHKLWDMKTLPSKKEREATAQSAEVMTQSSDNSKRVYTGDNCQQCGCGLFTVDETLHCPRGCEVKDDSIR